MRFLVTTHASAGKQSVGFISLLSWLPFGCNVLFRSGEGSEAVVGEEGRAVLLDEGFDGLTPPAGVSVATAL